MAITFLADFSTPGAGTWVVPANVTQLSVYVQGGSGSDWGHWNGATSLGNAGASFTVNVAVVPNQVISYTVGAKGAYIYGDGGSKPSNQPNNGGTTSFLIGTPQVINAGAGAGAGYGAGIQAQSPSYDGRIYITADIPADTTAPTCLSIQLPSVLI